MIEFPPIKEFGYGEGNQGREKDITEKIKLLTGRIFF